MIDFPILRDLGYVVIAAAALLYATRPLRLPPILMYMVGGLVLGPATGLLTVSESVHLFSELGIALLLFVVGLELSLAKVRDVGRTAVAAGVTQVAVTFLLGFALGLAVGMATTTAVLLGLVATFSSTVVVVKLLDRTGDLGALYGRIAIGILLVQDVLVAVVLTLLSGLGAGGGGEAGAAGAGATEAGAAGAAVGAHGGAAVAASSPWVALATAFLGIAALAVVGGIAARWLLPRVFDWLSESAEALFIASLTWAFAFILAAEALHVSVELGAFIAGVVLAQLPYNDELRRRTHPLVDFFLAVFFVALGAQMQPAAMAAQWPVALVVSTFVLLAKPVLIAVVLGLLGQTRVTAFLAGLTLGQISEFAFILAGLAIAAGLVPDSFLGLVGLVGLITIGVSAVLVPRGRALVGVLERRRLLRLLPGSGAAEAAVPERAGHVVVVGMNTLGRLIVRRFADRGESVLAVDTDATKLSGLPADTLLGSVNVPSVVEEAGIPRAKLVVSALQIEDVNSLLAYRCARMGVPVSIHAFDPSLAHELLEIGADHLMISKHDGIAQTERAFRELGVIG